MSDPDYCSKYFRRLHGRQLMPLVLALALLPAACGGTVVSKTEVGPGKNELTKPVTPSLHFWLGNSERNFYGSGPWSDGPLEIVWEAETGFISGRLHPDLWGGTSWPGQPAVDGNRVYFPSADGNIYCIDARDGSVIWKFKAKDSFKATPSIAGERIIASG
jgi:outer membrane protein assembly factor BamB